MNYNLTTLTALAINLLLWTACQTADADTVLLQASEPILQPTAATIDTLPYPQNIFENHNNFITDGFDFPVGKPDAKGYYNAQAFKENNHLGDDLNGTSGGNSDFGDPVYAIANGYVVHAENEYGGWGNVVRVIHKLPEGSGYGYVESLYAHLDSVAVTKGQWLRRGDYIGTIGNVDGIYWAHLHLELRHIVTMDLGGGYSTDTTGFLNPSKFIKANRPQ